MGNKATRFLIFLTALAFACRQNPQAGPAPQPAPLPPSAPSSAEPTDAEVVQAFATVQRPAFYKFGDGQSALLEPFKLSLPRRTPIVVPPGFVTDFSSVPKGLRPIVRGDHDLPGLVHDYLYWRQCPQGESDRLFLAALTERKLDWVTRIMMYLAVTGFGEKAWAQNGRDRASGLPRIVVPDSLPPPVVRWKRYRPLLKERGMPLDRLDATPPSDCPRPRSSRR
jgi:hypothetical protein